MATDDKTRAVLYALANNDNRQEDSHLHRLAQAARDEANAISEIARQAGGKASRVTGFHFLEAVEYHASALLRLYSGEYTFAEPQKED